MSDVVTRMAPSPTGKLHIGTAYATMWPYVFARHNGGKFILRIEDTDRERSTKEFEENIIAGLKNLGFEWDGDIPHQFDRLEVYQKYTQQLLDEGKAYYCFCTKEELDVERKRQQEEKQPQIYSGKCRNLSAEDVKANLDQGREYVIRFKMPEDRGEISFEDALHGKISFDSKLIGDTVIMRQNGIPLYNFAVVVDDIDMGITHVIRGDDHISNTPKQIVLYEALGKDLPVFAHSPVVLNQDRIGKLSKRSGSTSMDDFLKDGYLPEVLFNYIALLGWAPKDGREIFTKDELIEEFELKDLRPSPAAWNEDKLDWMNGEYIRMMSDAELTKRLQDFLVDHPSKDKIALVVPLIKERIKKLSDFIPLTDFIFEEPEYDIEVFKKLKINNQKEVIKDILSKLEELDSNWEKESFEKTFRDLASELNIQTGDFFQLFRAAVSGQLVTPPLFESLKIIGEENVILRLKNLLAHTEILPN